ncbi:MAG: hypothetical protein LBJ57_07060 [Prevotellaceae bacterium]|jgi:hypothetical protein|nr:hypothetical protein [Prevotellaceae bacterium]
MNINTNIVILCSALLGVVSCSSNDALSEESIVNIDDESGAYADKYDPISDAGQYTFPEMLTMPKKYWNCVYALTGSRNELGKTSETDGLQYHLLCQSISGLTNRAVDQGKSETGVWLCDHENRNSYTLSLNALQAMGMKEQGRQTGVELACNSYSPSEGVAIQIKDLFDGYVLTDVENNPESNAVASVASHVYSAIIVDVRDKEKYDAAGYTMKYDARYKTTHDSWTEFKDKCSAKALVVMPVQTGELRDFAIKNNLFVLNINRQINNSSAGQNLSIFEEALSWLDAGAPIFGWEQGVSEDLFVNRASKTGHVWIPSDWTYNIPMTSLRYKSRQASALAKVQNPKNIDYSRKKNFIAFYLTDGDNIQWMMNNFVEDFYSDGNAAQVKMGFGIPVGNLAMVSPPFLADIIGRQQDGCTIIESLGGGYSYVDNYGIDKDRAAQLESLACTVAAQMRQHRVKILGLMAHNVQSSEAQRGFQAFAEANDQLEGIAAIQYSPYSGGKGEIFWVKNKNGFDIPVVTIKYSLWNHGNRNAERDGTPKFVANRLNSEAKEDVSFSLIAVHAWSNFRDVGATSNELLENYSGDKKGASAAKLCLNHLDDKFEAVSVQELIWRIRMFYKKSQTEQYLNVIN